MREREPEAIRARSDWRSHRRQLDKRSVIHILAQLDRQKTGVGMQLYVAKINEEEKSFEQGLEQVWLGSVLAGRHSSDFLPTGSQIVTVWARRIGVDVMLRTDSTIHLKTECASCLSEFELEVPVIFSITLKPKFAKSGDMPEDFELTREDLEECFYRGDAIDLEEVLREQIILALPMYPRCNESCRGLCPVCGVNLNELSCSCKREEVDPRWLALRTITK